MAGASRTTQEALLREVYLKDFRRQFNVDSILLQSFKRNTKNYSTGKNISIAIHANQGSTYQWTNNNALPPADFEEVQRATFNYKMATTVVEIAGDFEEDAHGARAADVQPLDLEMRSTIVNARHGFNFDLFSDGTGLQATAAGATSGTVMTVDHVRGLRNGMRVDVLLKADGSVGGGVQGARVTVNAGTLTVTLGGGKTFGDFNAIQSSPTSYGVYRQNSRNNAIYGLDAIINTANPAGGNYGNIDRATAGNEFWHAQVHDNAGSPRTVNDSLMQAMLDDIETKSDCKTNLIVCHHSIWNTIAAVLTGLKRWNGDQMLLNGWARAITFAGIPIVRDKHCAPDRMYFLDTTVYTLYQNDEGKWMDKDGAILSRVPGFVAYQAAWYRRCQVICTAPIGQGVLKDLQ